MSDGIIGKFFVRFFIFGVLPSIVATFAYENWKNDKEENLGTGSSKSAITQVMDNLRAAPKTAETRPIQSGATRTENMQRSSTATSKSVAPTLRIEAMADGQKVDGFRVRLQSYTGYQDYKTQVNYVIMPLRYGETYHITVEYNANNVHYISDKLKIDAYWNGEQTKIVPMLGDPTLRVSAIVNGQEADNFVVRVQSSTGYQDYKAQIGYVFIPLKREETYHIAVSSYIGNTRYISEKFKMDANWNGLQTWKVPLSMEYNKSQGSQRRW